MMKNERVSWWVAATAVAVVGSAAAALAAGPDLDQGVDAKATVHALRGSAKESPAIQEREVASNAEKGSYEFDCREVAENKIKVENGGAIASFPEAHLTLRDGRLTVELEKGAYQASGLTVDKTYKPRQNTNMVRFIGLDNLGDDGDAYLLMDRKMFAGKAGNIKIEARGEVFSTSLLRCTPR